MCSCCVLLQVMSAGIDIRARVQQFMEQRMQTTMVLHTESPISNLLLPVLFVLFNVHHKKNER